IIISLTREELQLLRSLVIEIYAGVCIDAEEFEIFLGNSRLQSTHKSNLDDKSGANCNQRPKFKRWWNCI
nr:hypothetical protein [Neisseria meningitidis]